MAGDLFQDLPPPTVPQTKEMISLSTDTSQESSLKEVKMPTPSPSLKSALKRSKPPPESQSEAVPEKRLRFKTTTDVAEKQVIEAMQKISSHVKNTSKFNKASKLAIHLVQAGSVTPATRDHFFAVLDAAMFSLTSCNESGLRDDYHALFSAAQDVADCFSTRQQNLLKVWTIRAVWANELFTDDSFVFSKATGRIKEAISSLPLATQDDDMEEAAALKDETEALSLDGQINKEGSLEEESDPFGLDALMQNGSKKDEKSKGKKEALVNSRENDGGERRRFLKSERESLVSCLEIAAKRYKTPWCQTAIDILAKHAFDNISRFTTRQRDAIGNLWTSIREQQTRRKQGKSVSGKLDVNAFERLQEKYSKEKISIRRAVGGGGGRHCEQWLG